MRLRLADEGTSSRRVSQKYRFGAMELGGSHEKMDSDGPLQLASQAS